MSEDGLVVGMFTNLVIHEGATDHRRLKYPEDSCIWNDVYYNLGFNRSSIKFKWSEGAEYTGNLINSTTYNGVIGLIQRQEADISFCALSVPIEADPVNFGPYMSSADTGLYSVIDLPNYKTQLLGNCLIFKMDTVILLIAAIACFSLLMPFFEISNIKIRPFSLLKHHLSFLFYCISSLLRIPKYQPCSSAGKVLMCCYCASFMFFTWVWGNLLASDLTIYDTSSIINSLDDILRRQNIKIAFNQLEDPSHRIKTESNGKYEQILERGTLILRAQAMTAGAGKNEDAKSASNVQLFSEFSKGNVALMLSNYYARVVRVCCDFIAQHFKGNFYKGKEKLFSVMRAPYYGKHLNKSIARKLDIGFRRLSETGVYTKIGKTYLETMVDQMAVLFGSIGEAKCLYEAIDEYITEKGHKKEGAVNTFHARSLFAMLSVGIGAGGVALAIEMTTVAKMWLFIEPIKPHVQILACDLKHQLERMKLQPVRRKLCPIVDHHVFNGKRLSEQHAQQRADLTAFLALRRSLIQ